MLWDWRGQYTGIVFKIDFIAVDVPDKAPFTHLSFVSIAVVLYL